jgi:starch phosphorylase
MIKSNYFSKNEPGIFSSIIDGLLNDDNYCLFADFQSYVDLQDEVSRVYQNVDEWTKRSIYNVARIGKFSSDRSVKEYAENIWKVKPTPIKDITK